MAVLKDAVSLKEKGYATMAKSTVVPFELPSDFSPDPLTEVIQNGAKALLHTAIQAEVSSFIAEHAHLLDEAGRQRLVRHGFLPEREVMTGIGTVPVLKFVPVSGHWGTLPLSMKGEPNGTTSKNVHRRFQSRRG